MNDKRLVELTQVLRTLETESAHPESAILDTLNAAEIVRLINTEDKKTPLIVETALPEIARAAETAATALRKGGRVIYVGAGTSGRLGVLDAAECPPTFGTSPEQVVGLIAGGQETMIRSREGVEDDVAAASRDFAELSPRSTDFVVGIAASRRTPYTLRVLQDAKKIGCVTAFIICNAPENLECDPDIVISLPVGPEVVTGSTRLKSGTVTKMALNMISTGAMVLIGKTYGNLMVDLRAKIGRAHV